MQQDFFKHVAGVQSPHPVLFRYQHMFKGIKVGILLGYIYIFWLVGGLVLVLLIPSTVHTWAARWFPLSGRFPMLYVLGANADMTSSTLDTSVCGTANGSGKRLFTKSLCETRARPPTSFTHSGSFFF